MMDENGLDDLKIMTKDDIKVMDEYNNCLKYFIQSAFHSLRRAHYYVVSENPNRKEVTLFYLNTAIKKISLAEKLYFENRQYLFNDFTQSIFAQIDCAIDYLMEDFSEDHPLDTSYFDTLEKDFEDSHLSSPIQEPI